jgi:hypothetical protein
MLPSTLQNTSSFALVPGADISVGAWVWAKVDASRRFNFAGSDTAKFRQRWVAVWGPEDL